MIPDHANRDKDEIERILKAERNRRSNCKCTPTKVREWCSGGREHRWQKNCPCACHNRVRE